MAFRVPRWFVLHAFGWVYVLAQLFGRAGVAPRSAAPPSEDAPVVHWPAPLSRSEPAPNRDGTRPKPTDAAKKEHPSATLTFRLEHGFDAPFGKPNAYVYVPRAYDPAAPLRIITIFHGFKNCIASYVSPHGQMCLEGHDVGTGYDLPTQMEKAGTGAILVVPEISYGITSSDPGRLGESGEFRAFLTELLDALAPTIGRRRVEDIERFALLASSGGYQALEPVLDHGGVPVTDLYLLDAFYLYPDSAVGRFLHGALESYKPGAKNPRRFGILYSRKGGAMPQTEVLRAKAIEWLHAAGEDELGHFDPSGELPTIDELSKPVYILKVILMHDYIVGRYFWQMIKAGGV